MVYKEKDFAEFVENNSSHEYHYVSGYITTNSVVTIHHDKCNRDYTVVANEFKRGRRCWECWKKDQCKTNQWFIDKMKTLGISDYTPIGKYTRAKDKLLMRHDVCGYEWEVTPDNFLRRNSRCPKCAKNMRMTDKQFKSRMRKIIGSDYQFLEPYVNAHTPILCRHKTCNKVWRVSPDSLVQGTRCPHCQESKGESLVFSILTELDIEFSTQKRFDDCVDKKPLPFDFYIPSMNMCIEYDGEQHFFPVDFAGNGKKWAEKSFKLGQRRDSIKNNYCKEHNIQMVRVPYTMEDNDVEKLLVSKLSRK